MYVVADLAVLTHSKDFEEIAEKLEKIDIAMLVLNAGWTLVSPFKDLTSEEMERIVNINALHPIYLAKALI